MDSNKKGFWYKYKIILIISAVVLTFVAGTLFYFSRKELMDNIKVGAVLPLSGKGGYFGREVRDGMHLAIDEINARGGINERKIKLIIRDSRTDVEHGIEVFREIERKHNPLCYISALSLNSMALAPEAEKNEVVLFGLVTSARGVNGGKGMGFQVLSHGE